MFRWFQRLGGALAPSIALLSQPTYAMKRDREGEKFVTALPTTITNTVLPTATLSRPTTVSQLPYGSGQRYCLSGCSWCRPIWTPCTLTSGHEGQKTSGATRVCHEHHHVPHPAPPTQRAADRDHYADAIRVVGDHLTIWTGGTTQRSEREREQHERIQMQRAEETQTLKLRPQSHLSQSESTRIAQKLYTGREAPDPSEIPPNKFTRTTYFQERGIMGILDPIHA